MIDDQLDVLEAAVAGESHDAALEAAVLLWRACRAPLVADLVDDLTDVRPLAPLHFHAEEAEFEAAFHFRAAADDSDATTAALAASLRRPPSPDLARHRDNPLRWAAWHTRLQTLHARPPDPRLSFPLARLLAFPPSWVGMEEWKRVFDGRFDRLFIELADVRAIPSLAPAPRRSRDDWPEWTNGATVRRTHVSALIEAIQDEASRFAPLERDDRRRVDRCRELVGPRAAAARAKRSALLRAVLFDPEPLDALAVYADGLLDAGDPWGEFVSLSLHEGQRPSSPSRSQRRRAHAENETLRALLEEHEERWLGRGLSEVLSDRSWKNGMLHQASLVTHEDPSPAEIARGDARIGALAILRNGTASSEEMFEFLALPDLVGLQIVEFTPTPSCRLESFLRDLRRRPPTTFHKLAIHRVRTAGQVDQIMATLAALPQITHVAIPELPFGGVEPIEEAIEEALGPAASDFVESLCDSRAFARFPRRVSGP